MSTKNDNDTVSSAKSSFSNHARRSNDRTTETPNRDADDRRRSSQGRVAAEDYHSLQKKVMELERTVKREEARANDAETARNASDEQVLKLKKKALKHEEEKLETEKKLREATNEIAILKDHEQVLLIQGKSYLTNGLDLKQKLEDRQTVIDQMEKELDKLNKNLRVLTFEKRKADYKVEELDKKVRIYQEQIDELTTKASRDEQEFRKRLGELIDENKDFAEVNAFLVTRRTATLLRKGEEDEARIASLQKTVCDLQHQLHLPQSPSFPIYSPQYGDDEEEGMAQGETESMESQDPSRKRRRVLTNGHWPIPLPSKEADATTNEKYSTTAFFRDSDCDLKEELCDHDDFDFKA